MTFFETHIADGEFDSSLVIRLRESFVNARPFPHIIIDNFLNPELARSCLVTFDQSGSRGGWINYYNPIEIKIANNTRETWAEPLRYVFQEIFESPQMLAFVRAITGITNLELDPTLHGAGLHGHGLGGKLDMHLDYSIHPKIGKERRLNAIYYLNPGWEDTSPGSGALELRSRPEIPCTSIAPCFNRLVIFQTTDESWHGMPDPILHLPKNGFDVRRSLAYYYVSDPRPEASPRKKALFVRTDGNDDAWYDNLLRERSERSIPPQWNWRPNWPLRYPPVRSN